MRTLSILLPAVMTLFLSIQVTEMRSQGCSDAGVCTAGSFHTSNLDSLYSGSELNSSIGLSLGYEVGEQRTNYFSPQIEFSTALWENAFFEARLPYFFINGNLGTNRGFSDVTATFIQQLSVGNTVQLRMLVGARIATGNANESQNDRVLPMPYQTSLGTHDLLLSVAAQYRRLHLTVGSQIPIVQQNENTYNADEFNESGDYFISNRLQRQPDVIAKMEYELKRGKTSFKPGLLGIYHVGEDEIENPLLNREFTPVVGSEGLTVNLIGLVRHRFSNHWHATFSGGAPITVREKRPDGLTRFFVVRTGVTYRF